MAEGSFNNWVSGIAALLGLVSTGAASYGAWQAELAKQKAGDAQLAAETAGRAFAEMQYRDKQQFELYGKIEALLKEASDGSLVLAATYVALVGDPRAKAVWCAAVLNYAHIRETALTPAERNAVLYAKECLSDAAEQRAEPLAVAAVKMVAGAAPVAAAAPTAAATASATAARWPDKKIVSQGKALGYDIDVFACESGGAASSARALQLAERLALQSSQTGKIAHADLGRVRLRWLSSAQEASGGYPAGRNQVQADDDRSEERIAEALALLGEEATGQSFTAGRSASGTDFYLSVFACGP
jgi:hypothetical protein